jgi:hypothetical protein
MANGDDGYVDTGGGNSVWWKLRVSDGTNFDTALDAKIHTERKPGRAAYILSGQDTYAKTAHEGSEYYVVTIPDASDVRIVVDGDALRLFLPVKERAPGQMPSDERDIDHGRNPQIRIRWGVRQAISGMTWANFRKALSSV